VEAKIRRYGRRYRHIPGRKSHERGRRKKENAHEYNYCNVRLLGAQWCGVETCRMDLGGRGNGGEKILIGDSNLSSEVNPTDRDKEKGTKRQKQNSPLRCYKCITRKEFKGRGGTVEKWGGARYKEPGRACSRRRS